MRDLDKRRMGDLIRRLRERRGMTQRELAQAAGLGESALRSYELGARYPKERHFEPLAKALRVRPEVFEVYGIETELQLIHAMFHFEDRFDIHPSKDGKPSIEAKGPGILPTAFKAWGEMYRLLESGKITKQEYEEWKDTYNPAIRIDEDGVKEIPDIYTGKLGSLSNPNRLFGDNDAADE